MPEDDHPVSPIVVKKYANRRLYDTESSIYITLDTLADMVRQGRDFVVYDAKTGDDITRSVLTQIIMEEEIRGRNMLPTAFLRQLIGFYGDSMQGLVPEYLERMMDQFASQQSQVRAAAHRTMQNFLPPPPIEEVGRQNLAVMDRAISMFSPLFGAAADARHPGPAPEPVAEARPPEPDELAALRAEVIRLRDELACMSAKLGQRPIGGAGLNGDLETVLDDRECAAPGVAKVVAASGIRH